MKLDEELDKLAQSTCELASRVDVSPQDVARMLFEVVIVLGLLLRQVEERRG